MMLLTFSGGFHARCCIHSVTKQTIARHLETNNAGTHWPYSRHHIVAQTTNWLPTTNEFNSALWTYIHPFSGLFSRTTWISQHQKGQTILDFNGAAVASAGPCAIICTSLQTGNNSSTSSLDFYRLDAIPDTQLTTVRALRATSMKHAYNGKDWQMINIISEASVYHTANTARLLCPTTCMHSRLNHKRHYLHSSTNWISSHLTQITYKYDIRLMSILTSADRRARRQFQAVFPLITGSFPM